MEIDYINFTKNKINPSVIKSHPKLITREELLIHIENEFASLRTAGFFNKSDNEKLSSAMSLYGVFTFYKQFVEINLLPKSHGSYSAINSYEYLYHFKPVDFLAKHNGTVYTIRRIGGNKTEIFNLPKSTLITIDEMCKLIVDDRTFFLKGQKIGRNEWYYLRDKILFCLPLFEYTHSDNIKYNVNTKKFKYSYNIDQRTAGSGWRRLEIYSGEIEPYAKFRNIFELIDSEKYKWD